MNSSRKLFETLFVIGGTLDEGISSAVFGFNTVTKAWKKFPDLTKARACHRAVFAESQESVVVVGGSNVWPSPGFGECEILNLNTAKPHYLTWRPLPALNQPRSCHGLCYFEDKVFACAGMMNPSRARGYGVEQFDLTDSCEVLDLSSEEQRWIEFPKLNLARFGTQLLPVHLGAKKFLLAIGGRGPHPAAEYSVEALELGGAESSWMLLQGAKLLSPRIDFAAAVVKNAQAGVDAADVVILGGNRVTEAQETDSSRNWELLHLSLGQEGQLMANVRFGGRLPSSRVGCRAALLQQLVEGKQHLTVAGGFRAWGEGQTTYGGPLDQSVAVMEIKHGPSEDASGSAGSWIDFSDAQIGAELQKLPTKLHAPAVCTALHDQEEHKTEL